MNLQERTEFLSLTPALRDKVVLLLTEANMLEHFMARGLHKIAIDALVDIAHAPPTVSVHTQRFTAMTALERIKEMK